jgi:hypothetical protein
VNDRDGGDISRRKFLLTAAGTAGAAVTGLSWAGPCPPPLLSVEGGTTAQTECVPSTPGQLPRLTLTSAAASGTYGWTVGHAFRRGDVPAGAFITSDASSTQADVRNRWSDGSVKFAVLSGVSPFTQGQAKAITLATTTASPGGASVAEPTSLDVSVAFTGDVSGVYTLQSCLGVDRSSWSKSGAGRVRQILGPVMSEFHYYRPTTDAHVAVWFYVRRYASGATEVETVVENGWLQVASPGLRRYAVTVSVAGATKYSGSLSHYHHSRWSRVDWIGTDPKITPRHDAAYLRSTKLVPNYGYTSPTSQAWSDPGAPSTWGTPLNNENPIPLDVGNLSPAMGDYGYHESIGLMPRLDALYVTCQDARAYRSMVGNARCQGRYSLHYRDETTGRPFKVSAPVGDSSYSTTVGFASGSSTTKYGTEGGSVSLPSTSGQTFNTYTPTHAHAPPYLAYLVTGRWVFMEQCQFNANFNWLCVPITRQGASGILMTSSGALTTRGVAWSWRTLGMAACVTPDSSTGLDGGLQAEYRGMCAANSTYYDTTYSAPSAPYANGLHGLAEYDYSPGETRPWMLDFVVAALGFVSDLEVVTGSAKTAHDRLRDWNYYWIVGRFGTTTANYCWQDAPQYSMAYGPAGYSKPSQYYSTWSQVYAANSLGTTCSVTGDPRNVSSDPNGTIVTGYWANLTPGLAYAVTHGAAGASAARALLAQAPTFKACEAGAVQYGGFHNNPIWGVVPR